MGFYIKNIIVPDVKSENGQWLKSFTVDSGEYATTRAYSNNTETLR